MEKTRIFSQRALQSCTALITCLLVLISATSLLAKSKVKTKESHKDIIIKARNLSLQRDRIQVSNILRKAIESYEKKSKQKNELQAELKKLLELFYSEKALHNYQIAESLHFNKPEEAISYLEKSIEVEPRNIKTLKLLSLLHLETADCESAFRIAQQSYGLNPYDQEISRLNFQALSCLKNVEQFKAFDLRVQEKWKLEDIYFLLTLAKVQILQEQLTEALNTLTIIKKTTVGFPETYYVEAQVLEKKEQNSVPSLQSYLDKCQNRERLKKEFSFQPQLCSQVEEAEQKITHLKK